MSLVLLAIALFAVRAAVETLAANSLFCYCTSYNVALFFCSFYHRRETFPVVLTLPSLVPTQQFLSLLTPDTITLCLCAVGPDDSFVEPFHRVPFFAPSLILLFLSFHLLFGDDCVTPLCPPFVDHSASSKVRAATLPHLPTGTAKSDHIAMSP